MPSYKPFALNRRAKFDYAISETLLAGIALLGHEVKSIRAGSVSLKNSFASFKAGELWANNIHVSPYPPAKLPASHEPTRARKLLVHKKQLDELMAKAQAPQSIVVLSIGRQGRFIKLELGIGRGKKQYDKRETIKRRQAERDAARAVQKHARG